MLRSKPKLTYSGLTVVMSNPSRFDTLRLLSANAGVMFSNHCLAPEINVMQCDIRLMEDLEVFLPGTKVILLLGEAAMWKYLPETRNNNLKEVRGGLYYINNIPTICSFLPQECVDFKNYEQENNPLSKDYTPDDKVSEDGDESDEGDVKRYGKTKRANYCFWLRADVKKCKAILKKGADRSTTPLYKIYAELNDAINVLNTTKHQYLYLDIETDYEQQNLQCFAFSFDGQTIYSVPVLDFNYRLAYGNSTYQLLRALSIAMRDNVVVAHNGATFDFFVLANKYKIPIVKSYDTMIAHHRCFPDVERSLGHCTSYWTYEKFHKDEDSVAYRTESQMMDRLKYCGKDVYTMYLIKQAIDIYSKTIPGLENSINAAMRCIRPYLTSTLQGIRTDEKKIKAMVNENDRLMMQYNRLIEFLIGQEGMLRIRNGKKVGLMAGSNVQCVRYFHDILGYGVVGYGKVKDDGSKSPSLGKKALYKLALKYSNPVITLICAYRQVQKETSRLRFTPWPSHYEKLYPSNSITTRPMDNTNIETQGELAEFELE